MIATLAMVASLVNPVVTHEPYAWRQVPIGPLGFATGMVIHPHEPGVQYMRTDVGGVYGWEPEARRWHPLTDRLIRDEPIFQGGIESVAIDPSHPDRVYVASGDIFRSDDRGSTWQALGLRQPNGELVRMASNDPWRNAGERLAVDPNAEGNSILFGSRDHGLWRSSDAGTTWDRVASFTSVGLENVGITFVQFDPRSGSVSQPSQKLYAGLAGAGVLFSEDAGDTWQPLPGPGENFQPLRGAMADDGALYVTFLRGTTWTGDGHGAVFRYQDGEARDVTPTGFSQGYCGVSVDPNNSQRVVVTPWPWADETSMVTLESADGGVTWRPQPAIFDIPEWWVTYTMQNWNATVLIDPHAPQRRWLTNGYGVYTTADATQEPQRWGVESDGIEELVGQHVRKPPGGPLLFAVCDKTGFTLEQWDRTPETKWDPGFFGYATGIDFSPQNPEFVVRASVNSDQNLPTSGYSTDGGRTWTPFATVPEGGLFGGIAVSATQPDTIVFMTPGPEGQVYRTTDRGGTWTRAQAPSRFWFNTVFAYQAPLVADRIKGDTFYLYGIQNGEFWRSEDAGANWSLVSEGVLPENWRTVVRAAPDREGELWLVSVGEAEQPLWRSTDGGETWTAMVGVSEASGFGFGAQTESGRPSFYFWGNVAGFGRGMYRSDDLMATGGSGVAARWAKIDTDEQPIPMASWNGVEPDPDQPGRVFVSVGGRGLMVGERLPAR